MLYVLIAWEKVMFLFSVNLFLSANKSFVNKTSHICLKKKELTILSIVFMQYFFYSNEKIFWYLEMFIKFSLVIVVKYKTLLNFFVCIKLL